MKRRIYELKKEKALEGLKDYVSDSISDFFCYDRKEDERLQRGDLEWAVHEGVITADELAKMFYDEVMNALSEKNIAGMNKPDEEDEDVEDGW